MSGEDEFVRFKETSGGVDIDKVSDAINQVDHSIFDLFGRFCSGYCVAEHCVESLKDETVWEGIGPVTLIINLLNCITMGITLCTGNCHILGQILFLADKGVKLLQYYLDTVSLQLLYIQLPIFICNINLSCLSNIYLKSHLLEKSASVVTKMQIMYLKVGL